MTSINSFTRAHHGAARNRSGQERGGHLICFALMLRLTAISNVFRPPSGLPLHDTNRPDSQPGHLSGRRMNRAESGCARRRAVASPIFYGTPCKPLPQSRSLSHSALPPRVLLAMAGCSSHSTQRWSLRHPAPRIAQEPDDGLPCLRPRRHRIRRGNRHGHGPPGSFQRRCDRRHHHHFWRATCGIAIETMRCCHAPISVAWRRTWWP